MEEIDVQVGESFVLPNYRKYEFPVISFVRDMHLVKCPYAYFNDKCNHLLEGYRFVRIYKTADHMVFSPQKQDSVGCFSLGFDSRGHRRINTNHFKNLNLSGKSYKLYRCKHGFAIKLDEPLVQKDKVCEEGTK